VGGAVGLGVSIGMVGEGIAEGDGLGDGDGLAVGCTNGGSVGAGDGVTIAICVGVGPGAERSRMAPPPASTMRASAMMLAVRNIWPLPGDSLACRLRYVTPSDCSRKLHRLQNSASPGFWRPQRGHFMVAAGMVER
jgi:hypothetical protein